MPCMRVNLNVRATCSGNRARTTKTSRSGKNDGEEVVDMQYPVPLVSYSQHRLISLKLNRRASVKVAKPQYLMRQTSNLIQSIYQTYRLGNGCKTSLSRLLSSLSHTSFVFVKNEFFECELNGIAARRWYDMSFRKVDLELARLPK